MKKLMQLLAIGSIATVISACGNGGDESEDDAASDEEAATEEDSGTEENASGEGDSASEEDRATESDSGTEGESSPNDDDSSTSEEGSSAEEFDTGGQEETRTYVAEDQGYTNTLVYTYVDDEVVNQTSQTEATYESLGVTDRAEAEEVLGSAVESYENTDGVEHSIEYGEDALQERLEIDYDTVDISEVAELDGAEFEGDTETAQFVSMSQTEQQLLDQGYALEE